MLYGVYDPLGMFENYEFTYDFYNNQPQICSTINDVKIHATQPLDYYISDNFFSDEDAYIERLRLTIEIDSDCSAAWIKTSTKPLRLHGKMPVFEYQRDSAVISEVTDTDIYGNIVKSKYTECKFSVVINVTDDLSLPVSTNFIIVLYNNEIY